MIAPQVMWAKLEKVGQMIEKSEIRQYLLELVVWVESCAGMT